ncbi:MULTISPECIES: hypothetical protein [unclassified Actinopolyspora]|uniref:hypothetical protein n=1 Tax=unclassified Actinopolyspora TaxID=2639451 RepID=UPI0013F66A8F|nr:MULTISPECIES: hypothetical protein [unclassified Actinopolyspora]NHD16585.1 hypothetical protein [Actinopolyspora sp. BKK2]NHE75552.1 hypothetical protein [Actinopolyspora sp. BKK1]
MSVSRSTPRRRQSGSPARKPRVAGTRNRASTAAGASPRADAPAEQDAGQDTSTVAGQDSAETAAEETGAAEAGAVDGTEPATAAAADAAEDATTGGPASGEDGPSEQDSAAEAGAAEAGAAEVGTAEADTAESTSTVDDGSDEDSERGEEPERSRGEVAPGRGSGATGSADGQREPAASPAESSGGRGRRSWRRASDSGSRSGLSSGHVRTVLTAVLLVLALGFGGLAYWFHQTAHALRHEGPSANAALVDEATTSEVKGQIGSAVEKLFSYDYSNVGKTDKAAENLLVGEAVEQYDKMFKTVREQAPKQKMKLTSTVARSGVTLLEGDRAEVLVFVNQEATSAKSDEGGMYPAQLTVQAEKRSGEWKISGMSQFAR